MEFLNDFSMAVKMLIAEKCWSIVARKFERIRESYDSTITIAIVSLLS